MRSSDTSARHPLPRLRQAPRDLRLPLRRDGVRLPWRWDPSPARQVLTFDEILHAARAVAGRPGAFLLSDDDPLRREDAWELIAELAQLRPAHLGLCSAGRGITPTVAERLRALGVARLHVPFLCARRDAHDWLVGRSAR